MLSWWFFTLTLGLGCREVFFLERINPSFKGSPFHYAAQVDIKLLLISQQLLRVGTHHLALVADVVLWCRATSTPAFYH